MSNNMDDLFANVKKMVDSGNIPDDIKQMMNNLQNNSNNSSSSVPQQASSSSAPDLNNILSQISPEMINNLQESKSWDLTEEQKENANSRNEQELFVPIIEDNQR